MTRAVLLAALALSFAAPAAADNRLQTRVYDADAVVQVEGRTKVQTTIKFGPDEVIENVAIGDSAAWQVQPNKAQTILFVKPLEPAARTNMTVVTDKRTYLFDLVASPKSSALYVLQFRYPELEKAAEEARLAALAEAEMKAIRATLPETLSDPDQALGDNANQAFDPAALNHSWARSGTPELLPTTAYDNGTAVFLTWPEGSGVPALLVTNESGEEGPVNFTVRGNTIIVDGVPPKLILRSGRATATLTNTAGPAPGPVRARLSVPHNKGEI
ncbi:TrbG/VirB9 family P-type conjugative transfer protein [Erythrobacter sp. NE805]|uniref:TrbG/VirB9 family P-type conjugative transfer protein n=1 Tax=Erythrobacter sp. NE805 TaxID=3389875 RepID=UPI00396B1880